MTTSHKGNWILYSLITTLFWGVWGAFIEIPEKAGFPATLGYVVWSLSMIPCAVVALYNVKWKLEYDLKSIMLGSAAGLLGAGGQLLLFQALRQGPAYIVFPFISLFPICTIVLSFFILREKVHRKQAIGVLLALVGIFLLSSQPAKSTEVVDGSWIFLSILVFIMWGIQGFVMKFSNNVMKAESIFFYMTLTALLLSPVAFYMTDFNQEINTGWKGPYLAFFIHLLNAIGALTLVYALRYGKAIVVVPMTGLSPIITVVLSLVIYSVIPSLPIAAGLIVASIAIYLLSE
jgi:uncharacterized membrane protein